jgi:RNA polymerase sigma-70 factor (ECF subfamily)
MDRDSELALVARLRTGDTAAFDTVVERFRLPLFSFLLRLSRRRDVAEDLLEETWLRLVGRVHLLRDDTRLGPWLFTVARNLYASHCRSRLLEDSHVASLIGLWPCGSAPASPFDSTAATESERRIEAALAALPILYREALLLVGVQGLSITEAATICGVSPVAMRQRVSRARARVARQLDDVVRGLTSLREVET